MAKCGVCFRHCNIVDGQLGFCGARIAKNGRVEAYNYGRITSIALDPIEKKPLARFFPGSLILSVGSFGCNLRCPFCQNSDISWSEHAKKYSVTADTISPKELVELALSLRKKGNIGIAFTYNEPFVGYEFVRDTAKLAKEKGLINVVVTNGTAEPEVLDEIGPYIDAMNIDLKGFDEKRYKNELGGDLEQVKVFIKNAVKFCHVELTTLVVPGENDTEDEIREIAKWISDLKNPDGEEITLHITRFFPRFHMKDRKATDVSVVYHLAETAREYLRYVYTGNC